jgi:hypothetical protein
MWTLIVAGPFAVAAATCAEMSMTVGGVFSSTTTLCSIVG